MYAYIVHTLTHMDTQTIYQQALKFAAGKHAAINQTIPGTSLPYTVHISNVAMEILLAAAHTPEDFDLNLAIPLALLHDTLEDTGTTFQELEAAFGPAVAHGVAALSKNAALPKSARMADSLSRVKALQKEVWAVKLADRITNLQVPPPHWDSEKKAAYRQEALTIAAQLEGANAYLENRLREKIKAYQAYI